MKWTSINTAIGIMLAVMGGYSLYAHQTRAYMTNGDFVLFWILVIGGVLLAVMSVIFRGEPRNNREK